MTEYDFSPEAYERYLHTQNRVANWVQYTEQHRPVFEAAAPGAPGVTPVPRRRSPPLERYLSPHRPSLVYPNAPPMYRRGPASSSSEDSYVHVPSPQIHRSRPPPPIYAPPPPPGFAPFPVQPHPSPVTSRHPRYEHYHSSTSRHRHHRSQSQSYSRRPPPPPLVTPIYTSPPASPYYPSPGYIYMSPPGYPTHRTDRPVINRYGRLSIDQTLPPYSRKAHYQLEKPPTLSSASDSSSSDCSTSAPNSPASLPHPHPPVTPGTRVLNSRFGGSYAPLSPPPLTQQDQNHAHPSTHIPPISSFSRGLQQTHTPQGQNLHHTSHPSFNLPRNYASISQPQATSPVVDDQNQDYGYDYDYNYDYRQPNGKRDFGPTRPNITGDITISVPKPRYGYLSANSIPNNNTNQNQFKMVDEESRYGTGNGYLTQKTPVPTPKPSRFHSISRILSPKTTRASARA